MTIARRGNQKARLVDKCLGVPLIHFAGYRRKKLRIPSDVKKIGIIVLGAVGDFILASYVIDDLRSRFPDAEIIGFTTSVNMSMSDIISGWDRIVQIHLGNPLFSMKAMRQEKIDILFDFGQWARISALLTTFAAPRFSIGFRTVGQHRHSAFDVHVDHRSDQHEIENFRDLVRVLDIDPKSRARILPDILASRGSIDLPENYVVLHPWAAGFKHEFREWPITRWTKLAQHLINKGLHIIISGGPSDKERSAFLTKSIGSSSVTALAGQTKLSDMVPILSRAKAVVSVNTGIMHMAALMDRPMVALHGPTNPHRWGPLSDRAIVVGPGSNQGGAYLNLGWEYPKTSGECMDLISVEEVLQSVTSLLDSPP